MHCGTALLSTPDQRHGHKRGGKDDSADGDQGDGGGAVGGRRGPGTTHCGAIMSARLETREEGAQLLWVCVEAAMGNSLEDVDVLVEPVVQGVKEIQRIGATILDVTGTTCLILVVGEAVVPQLDGRGDVAEGFRGKMGHGVALPNHAPHGRQPRGRVLRKSLISHARLAEVVERWWVPKVVVDVERGKHREASAKGVARDPDLAVPTSSQSFVHIRQDGRAELVVGVIKSLVDLAIGGISLVRNLEELEVGDPSDSVISAP
mmetsp:Transcript_50453/g.109679  ORF Transcript_50453/g.109679 Transcript_50453/m.109679 type:complete len:262 (+) Transcript_50453:59-844(+)